MPNTPAQSATPKPLLPVDDARARILADMDVLGSERVALTDLVTDPIPRRLATTVHATRAMPAFDNSAMDGFAVRSADFDADFGQHRLDHAFVVSGQVLAGDVNPPAITEGTALRINTGAPIPPGVDAVIMREVWEENTDAEGQVSVSTRSGRPEKGLNIRRRGEDVDVGDVVGAAHALLSPARLNLLWSAGLTAVDVVRRPRVAILASGDELVELGQPAGDHAVINSNAWSIAAACRRLGCDVRLLGIAADTLEDHVARMDVDDVDVLLTIGGVSMGTHDFVRPALEELGATLHLWKLAMRPGKPLAFGSLPRRKRPVQVFGLPGNPVSALVTFQLFVRPALLKLSGDDDVKDTVAADTLEATFADDVPFKKKPGLRVFVRAAVERERAANGWRLKVLERQSSGQISGLADATALLDVGVDVTEVAPGSTVRFVPLG